jgi:hypothetical protein
LCQPESEELHGAHDILGMLLLNEFPEFVKIVHQAL